LFVLGVSFLLGGLKHHTQEYNRFSARFQAGLLLIVYAIFAMTLYLLPPQGA
jgi:Ca2+:H+ antiporter